MIKGVVCWYYVESDFKIKEFNNLDLIYLDHNLVLKC